MKKQIVANDHHLAIEITLVTRLKNPSQLFHMTLTRLRNPSLFIEELLQMQRMEQSPSPR